VVVSLFFMVDVFFLVVAPACVVVAVLEVAAVVSSFFCAWQEVKNATVARAVIKDKTDVFIGLVRLNRSRVFSSRRERKQLNCDSAELSL
jgi:hypothetical protein